MDKSVTKILIQLREQRDLHFEVVERSSGTNSEAIFTVDFLAIAALNRSLALTRGFCDLIESKNFLSAVPLIRLQLDSCLRMHAVLSAENPEGVAKKVFSGDRISNLQDRFGNRMTDYYLREQLAKNHPWINDVYKNTSGFIHLSDRHIFNALKIRDETDQTVWFKVSDEDAFVPGWAYLEAVRAFKEATKILLSLVWAWGDMKKQWIGDGKISSS